MLVVCTVLFPCWFNFIWFQYSWRSIILFRFSNTVSVKFGEALLGFNEKIPLQFLLTRFRYEKSMFHNGIVFSKYYIR